MGYRSIVFGHIETLGNQSYEANKQALRAFQFDDLYPFPDIFRIESPPRYKAPSIFFGGTFKQLEEDWLTWFDQFVSLLSTLEAVEANVVLDCWLGRFAWTLAPRSLVEAERVQLLTSSERKAMPISQPWCIVQAPTVLGDAHDLLSPVSIPVLIDPTHTYGH
jgi:hypothetical protein